MYDLTLDPKETTNLYESRPELAMRMTTAMAELQRSISQSYDGKDYPEGKLLPGDPSPRFLMDVEAYRPNFMQWRNPPEYESRLKTKKK